MAKAKQLNVSSLTKLLKELTAVGEFIKVKQDEKQSVIDDFEKEKVRFRQGKISQSTLVSSTKKTNNELMKLDKSIRDSIAKSRRIGDQTRKLLSNQAPNVVRAKIAGVASSKRSSKPSKKKPSKKSGLAKTMKKERSLDKKYQR